MTDILTITLNPAVDISTNVDQVTPGHKLRCAAPATDPGGGGINVSRAIRILGGESTAFVALGGATGQQLAELLKQEKIVFTAFPAPGDTRQSISVMESSSARQYRFVMPGSQWQPDMQDQVVTAIRAATEPGNLIVLSGSLPVGIPPDFVTRLRIALNAVNTTLIVDTSGAPLQHLVSNPVNVDILRMDEQEARALAAHPLNTRADTAAFAQSLVRSGVAGIVIIARGADGTTLVSAGDKLHCRCDVDHVVSKVGAGDSFVAGFALALSKGTTNAVALRHGTAAASAAVMTDGTQLCTQIDAERLLPECELTQL